MKEIKYCIFDPTGNITALVETPVPVEDQPEAAAVIMRKHPNVEQVGFVGYCEAEDDAQISMRMAGGEFCGNASMCAAALYAARYPQQAAERVDGFERIDGSERSDGSSGETVISVRSSGADAPLEVRLRKAADDMYLTSILMPPAYGVEEIGSGYPVVHMQGIDHIIVESDNPMYPLRDEPDRAEETIKKLCAELGADGLGMMFISGGSSEGGSSECGSSECGNSECGSSEGGKSEYNLLPLVYIPGADTIFWENSCASGSAAAGIYLASKAGEAVDVTFAEPAGCLRVKSDLADGRTVLSGSAALIDESSVDF